MRHSIPALTALVCLAMMALVSCAQAESLEMKSTRRLDLGTGDWPVGFTHALMLGDDTLVVAVAGSGGGVWAQFDRQQPWVKLIGCQSASEDWWIDCDDRTTLDDLYLPLDLGYLPSSGDVLIFDGHCNRLFTLDLSAVASSSAESWRYVRGGDYIDRVSFQGDCLLTGLYCENQDMMLAVETLGDDDSYRRIIPVSRPLQAHLDSVGLGYTSSMAAVDPSSGRIWVVICDYDYILVSTGDGLVVDSAHICSPDYVSARPPLSRVKSQAVWEQWMRSRTYKTAFKYVAPGYFILQYDVSHNAPDHEGKMSFGTSVWNTRIEPIHVDIDPTWQLAGACDDGRLIFGRFAMQDSSRYFEYIFAEIEP